MQALMDELGYQSGVPSDSLKTAMPEATL